MKSGSVIPLAIIMGGLILAGAVYITVSTSENGPTGDPSLVRPVDASDHISGNPAAPVILIEYADFECEFCRGINDTLHNVVANTGTGGEVAVVFRHFPITEKHPTAFLAARAAECVALTAGTDAFWKFADSLFANQPIDPNTLGSLASSAGAPSAAFTACYVNAETTVDSRINADRKNAIDAGAHGTPYTLLQVAGKAPVVIDGAYSYDVLKGFVDRALSSAQ